jgi:hypothetical protein
MEINKWFDTICDSSKFCNKWCTSNELYKDFISFNTPDTTPIISYQSFLKYMNTMELNNKLIVRCTKRSYGEVRLYYYYIFHNMKSSINEDTTITRSTYITSTRHNISHSSPITTSDEHSIPVTPIDNRTNDKTNTIIHKSKMSMPHTRPLKEHTLLAISQSKTSHIPPYTILHKYGIPTDLSVASNVSIMQSILRDIDKLNNTYCLSFPRANNNIVKPFFIPSRMSSQQSFNKWDKGNDGLTGVLSYMSNGTLHPKTSSPIAVDYLLHKISKAYPKSFYNLANNLGYDIPKRMNAIETAAVLSEVGVGDKKILTTLHKHIKAKYNGRPIFCPKECLQSLTTRIPKMICNESLFEKEEGLKMESIGIAGIDAVEAIRLDMERYIEAKYNASNIFTETLRETPLFGTRTYADNSGTYILIGTDHGQGTAQFMLRILS